MLKIFFIFVLTLSLSSHSFAKDTYSCHCVKNRAQHTKFDFNRIPPYWFVRDSIKCLELVSATKMMDQLDKDVLILRALNYTKKHFKTLLSHEGIRRPYAKVLTDKEIDRLYTFLDATFPHRKLQE